MKDSYEKISPTAKMVAYLRTFTDIPFTNEIALESGAEQAFRELAGQSAETMVHNTPFLEARYKATSQILAQRHITQVLEIAAGLSPRGLAMTADPAVVYAVTDLPEILAQIKTIAGVILASSNSQRPNLHFQIANALDRESLQAAASVFDPQQPIAIVTEGLLPYLNRQEKTILAGNIGQLLRKYAGSMWITSDVNTRQAIGKVSQADEHTRQRISRISDSTGSDLADNAFADENEIQQFFTSAGFAIEDYQQADTLALLSSIERLNLTETEIATTQQMLKELRKTIILTPQKV